MKAIAVQQLARADSVSIGFIGCGVQARSHFDVLRLVLPDLKEVVVCSRSAASAERFVAMVRGAGLVARTTLEPREAIEGLLDNQGPQKTLSWRKVCPPRMPVNYMILLTT